MSARKETTLPLIGTNQDTLHIEGGGFPSFEEMIRSIAELGLDLFEFCPEYIEQTPDALTPERRRAALALAQSLGVKLLVHASFASVNICFINDHTRAESVRQLKREIHLAHDLESDAITIHPGPPTGHFRWYTKDMFWEMMLRSYEELLAFAEPLGVLICTENMSARFVGKEDDLSRLFADIDCPGFGLTLDIGHHNLIYNDCPLPTRTARMKEIVGRFADKIRVLHIHDNRGVRDDHEGLGWGEIDYDATIPEVLRVGVDAYWSMELAGREAAVQSKATLSEYLC
jgi:sugar phosphate isomerase/epimerase